MAIIDLNSGKQSDHLAKAAAALKDGYVIVAPLENSYALVADAFFHDAVRALHVLRGDALGVAAQVLISSTNAIDGIAREVSDAARALMTNFWPGLLSLNLKPQRGLNWDLGDGQQLDSFSVRVPSAQFISELAKVHGPLAVASAALSGKSAINDPSELNFSDIEVAAIFSSGPLEQGLASTIVATEGGSLRIVRVGAISAEQITAIAPDISVE